MLASKVLIIGGGYAGNGLAQTLDREFDVTLIDSRPTFFHHIGALRAVVHPGWAAKLSLSRDRALKRGQFVNATVTAVNPDCSVTTQDGLRYAANFVVLAFGSLYPFPAHPPADDDIAGRYAALADQVRTAKSIVIAGGGPVGVELAGEITAVYRDKQVTLVDPGSQLIPRFTNPRLGQRLQRKLEQRGVRFRFGERAVAPGDDPGTLVIPCYGAGPATAALTAHLGSALDQSGRVIVEPTLQVRGFDSMFAIGDIVGLDEPKTAIVASDHVRIVAANIRLLASSKRPSIRHRPSRLATMAVPLGPDDGLAHFQIGAGVVVGGPIGKFKSRDLLLSRYRKKLNLA